MADEPHPMTDLPVDPTCYLDGDKVIVSLPTLTLFLTFEEVGRLYDVLQNELFGLVFDAAGEENQNAVLVSDVLLPRGDAWRLMESLFAIVSREQEQSDVPKVDWKNEGF